MPALEKMKVAAAGLDSLIDQIIALSQQLPTNLTRDAEHIEGACTSIEVLLDVVGPPLARSMLRKGNLTASSNSAEETGKLQANLITSDKRNVGHKVLVPEHP